MGKFLDSYLEKFPELPPVQITSPEMREPETTDEIPFYKALDQAIVAFVRTRYNGFVPDLKEFLYEFCRVYPVRESDIKPRVEMLKTRGWRI